MNQHASRSTRRALAASCALLVAAGAAGPALADSPGFTEPPRAAGLEPVRVELKASRVVGFAPLTVDLKGTAEAADGQAVPLGPFDTAALAVECGSVTIRNGGSQVPVFTSGAALMETDAADPLSRRLIIHRPGTYTMRFLVGTEGRGRVVSNEVQIRVL